MTAKHNPPHDAARRPKERIVVHSWEEVPDFANECEEHEFWKTHSFGPGMLDNAMPDPRLDKLLPVRPRSITIRLDADVYIRLRTLARQKGRPYQTLLKEFLVERLYEEEKREGIVGG